MGHRSKVRGRTCLVLLGLLVPAADLALSAAAHAAPRQSSGPELRGHPSVREGNPFVGTVLRDTATVAGTVHPTGTVTFTLYYNNFSCDSAARVFSNSQPLSPAGTATSAPYTATAAGVYQWVAGYGGDANYEAVSGGCGDTSEQTTVRVRPCPGPDRGSGFASPVDNGFNNAGDFDNGDGNTGDLNNGDCNTGSLNNGDRNTGDGHDGDAQAGDAPFGRWQF